MSTPPNRDKETFTVTFKTVTIPCRPRYGYMFDNSTVERSSPVIGRGRQHVLTRRENDAEAEIRMKALLTNTVPEIESVTTYEDVNLWIREYRNRIYTPGKIGVYKELVTGEYDPDYHINMTTNNIDCDIMQRIRSLRRLVDAYETEKYTVFLQDPVQYILKEASEICSDYRKVKFYAPNDSVMVTDLDKMYTYPKFDGNSDTIPYAWYVNNIIPNDIGAECRDYIMSVYGKTGFVFAMKPNFTGVYIDSITFRLYLVGRERPIENTYEITYIMNYYNIRKQVYAKDKSYWYTDMFTVSTYNAEMSKILNDLLVDFVSGYVPGH